MLNEAHQVYDLIRLVWKRIGSVAKWFRMPPENKLPGNRSLYSMKNIELSRETSTSRFQLKASFESKTEDHRFETTLGENIQPLENQSDHLEITSSDFDNQLSLDFAENCSNNVIE